MFFYVVFIDMLKLEAKRREVLGSKVSNLLKDGFIPAEVYGHGFENIHVSISSKDFLKVFKEAGESSLISVSIDSKLFPAIIYEVQRDVLGDNIIHVDFYRVHMDEKIQATVPLVFVGDAPAVKEKGGVLVKSVEEVEVKALPGNLPHQLEVDLSSLVELHQSLHGRDIKAPEGVKVMIEPEMGIATVTEQQKEEVVEVPPTVEEGAATGIEGQTEEASVTTENQSQESVSKQK
jgi:large subunit ribosomal protein L25